MGPQLGSSYYFFGRIAEHNRFDVVLAQIIVPLKSSKGGMPHDRHNAFVISSLPHLAGYKSMAKLMKVQVRQAGLPTGGLEGGLPSRMGLPFLMVTTQPQSGG